jgi:hypothetical protein
LVNPPVEKVFPGKHFIIFYKCRNLFGEHNIVTVTKLNYSSEIIGVGGIKIISCLLFTAMCESCNIWKKICKK